MADSVSVTTGTGLAVYALFKNSAGQYWNGAAMEAFNGANWGDYDVPMTEEGTTGTYSVAVPAVPAGLISVEARIRAGGSPAQSDVPCGTLSGQPWSGTVWGDAYARLGAPAGASVSADIADLPTNAELATDLGTAAAANAAAVLAAATSTPIAANVEQINATPLSGTGVSGDSWRPT